jgi:hypothetical protein
MTRDSLQILPGKILLLLTNVTTLVLMDMLEMIAVLMFQSVDQVIS